MFERNDQDQDEAAASEAVVVDLGDVSLMNPIDISQLDIDQLPTMVIDNTDPSL